MCVRGRINLDTQHFDTQVDTQDGELTDGPVDTQVDAQLRDLGFWLEFYRETWDFGSNFICSAFLYLRRILARILSFGARYHQFLGGK